MRRLIPRRAVLTLGPATLSSCGMREPYFGRSTPPGDQTPGLRIGGEPTSLDPATAVGGTEGDVFPALFEPLLSKDRDTLDPAAGLATHYRIDAGLMEFRFFLRGHPSPGGSRLPGAPDRCAAASWSDGRLVTAEDFVFAWRRLVDPANGGSYGFSSLSRRERKGDQRGKGSAGNSGGQRGRRIHAAGRA